MMPNLPDDPVAGISLFVGAMSGLTLLLVAAAFTGGMPRQLRRRMLQISVTRAATRPSTVASGGAASVRPLSRRRPATGIERVLRWLPRRVTLVRRLEKTGRGITLAQYAIWTIGVALGASLLLAVAAGLGPIASLLSGLAIGLFLPHYVVGRMGRKRVTRFIALFPDTIDLMVRALRAGLPVTEAIINAGHEIGDPVGTELRGIEAGMMVGRDHDSLFWDIARRITAPEFRYLIIALNVQRE
ncbi:MAG: type II secretion system F family protein, partial [Alphaproteobacteria bacterium]